jgi:hypothetical protein
MTSPAAATLSSLGAASPNKAASSRRARNQPSRQHDLEFAAELGQGLIAEVRKLQGLLSERDETLKIVQLEKSRLEHHVAGIESRLRSLDDNEQKFKEENWNLELLIQDLNAQASEQKETEQRLQGHLRELEYEKNQAIKELDNMKIKFEKVNEELEVTSRHNESEINVLKRALATAEAEKENLQSKVKDLEVELEESHSITMRLRIQQERREAEEKRDPFDLPPPEEDDPEESLPQSPTKHTPRHGQLEAETLKSSLHHAHRLIQNLRSNMHREKTEKNELKRLLQETRDELESVRNGNFSATTPKEKRRRPDGTFKKLPKASVALLGIARKSKDEVVNVEHPKPQRSRERMRPIHDDEWEEAQEEISSEYGRAPGAYVSSVAPTDNEDDTAFDTAYEKDATDDFDTAHENDLTETEAYHTVHELDSPIRDEPTSADELTETEGKVRTVKPKSSGLSSRSLRPQRLAQLRHQRSSIVSTASTDDDDYDQYDPYRFTSADQDDEPYSPDGQYEDDLGALSPTMNPRLKLRINRNPRGKPNRFHEASMFNQNMFGIDSSPASANSPSSFNDSPRADRFVRNTAPDIRKSLFAELGNSPGMMSTDGDDDVDETPCKRLAPALFNREILPVDYEQEVEMVDSGMMTEEPYPEVPMLVQDEDGMSDRPSTAGTVVGTAALATLGGAAGATLLSGDEKEVEIPREPVVMCDTGMQWEELEEYKIYYAETSVQAEEIIVPVEMKEISIQAEEVIVPVKMAETFVQAEEIVVPVEVFSASTQSDPEPVVVLPELIHFGTQSDPEPEVVLPEQVHFGTQSDPEPEVIVPETVHFGTQSDPEPEPEVIPASTFTFVNGASLETEPIEEPAPEPVIVIKEVIKEVPIIKEVVKEVPIIKEVLVPAEKEPLPPSTLVRCQSVETEPIDEEPLEEVRELKRPVLAFSPITSEGIAPIAPAPSPIFAIAMPSAPVAVGSKGGEESDDEARKVSDRTASSRSPSPTPSAAEKKGFFSTLFGGRKHKEGESSVKSKKSFSSLSSKKSFSLSLRSKKSFSSTEEAVAELEEPVQQRRMEKKQEEERKQQQEEDNRMKLPEPPMISPLSIGLPPPTPTLYVTSDMACQTDMTADDIAVVEMEAATPRAVQMAPVPAFITQPALTAAPAARAMPAAIAATTASAATAAATTAASTSYAVELEALELEALEPAPAPFTMRAPPVLNRPPAEGRPETPQTPSRASSDSYPKNRMGAEGVRIISNASSVIRPDSSSSLRELRGIPTLSGDRATIGSQSNPAHIPETIEAPANHAAADARSHEMPPPPIPRAANGLSIRPRTPAESSRQPIAGPSSTGNQTQSQSQHSSYSSRYTSNPNERTDLRPSTGSSSLATPAGGKQHKFSATRSEVSSPGSRRSSLSSFVTELDDRFAMVHDGYPSTSAQAAQPATDPRVIQAITQTMIGEYLWKYTRNTGRGTMSNTRHKRFFWIHPYTRTLYWSERDPQTAGRAELRAKSVAIEAVRVVTDDNVSPPGLHRKSLVIITPGRTLKFTAPTGVRHEVWFNALSYLLLRDAQEGTAGQEAVEGLVQDETEVYQQQPTSPYSPTNRGNPGGSLSSLRSRGSSPPRNQSAMSQRTPGKQGSLSKLSNIFRPGSGFGNYSTREGGGSVYGISEASQSGEEIGAGGLCAHGHSHDDADGLENVRACCGGKCSATPVVIKGSWEIGANDIQECMMSELYHGKAERSLRELLHIEGSHMLMDIHIVMDDPI